MHIHLSSYSSAAGGFPAPGSVPAPGSGITFKAKIAEQFYDLSASSKEVQQTMAIYDFKVLLANQAGGDCK